MTRLLVALLLAAAGALPTSAAEPAEQPLPAPEPAAPPALGPQVAPPPLPAPPRPDVPPLPPRDPGELTPATRPLLAIGNDEYFAKPILVLAGGLHVEKFLESINQGKEDRVTTVAITRFGLEGRLGRHVSFRSEFERNIGAHGTGIWEGTASFSVRDQFIRLERWGVILDGGIILDEASVDFFSAHTADLLLADRYTRDPLLMSGFNRGQGLKVSYGRWGLRLGFAYTEANPLSTSSSFQVGGTFGGGSRFWEKPFANPRPGRPDDDFHFRVMSPSLVYSHRYIEVKTMAQIFTINYQTSSRSDPELMGYNLRGNLRLALGGKLWLPFQLSPFVNVAWLRNDVLNNTAGYADTLLSTQYSALSISAGLDLFINGRSGLGMSYSLVLDDSPGFSAPMGDRPAMEPTTRTTQHYINAGLTYWVSEHVAAAARVASYRRTQDQQPDELDISFLTTLRLVL